MPKKQKTVSAKQPAKQEKKASGRVFLGKPRGMHDILPSEWPWWERVLGVSEKLAGFYGFGKITTPILEHAAVFTKGVGEETDIVSKEMYTVRTKGGDLLALRPEGTAPIVRAYMEHSLARVNPVQKLWYEGPMFRHEKPQAGRYREFNQVGFEILGGISDPIYDAQVILLFWRMLGELKIKNTVLKLNSIGCRVCRPNYIKQLQAYYKNHTKDLCEDCVRRLKTNPLRLLDCQNEQCIAAKKDSPNLFDKLCAACSKHFRGVLEYLEELGISYRLDNHLVRGLDYYSRTVFEMFVEGVGEELKALPAGGRYDYLFEMLGGRPTPAVGAAVGIERLIAVMKAQEIILPTKRERRVFLVHVGEAAKKKLFGIMEDLRDAGIPVRDAFSKDSLKAQLKAANKEKAALAVIVGQQELFEDTVIIRDLSHGSQETVPHARMIQEVKKKLR